MSHGVDPDLKGLHDLQPRERLLSPDRVTGLGGLPFIEERLEEGFSALVDDLDLRSLVRLAPDRKMPKGIDDYQLIPIRPELPDWASWDTWNSSEPGRYVAIPDGIGVYHGGEGRKPYVDSAFAIGLVYRASLGAVASARITDTSSLQIVQLQGVYSPLGREDKSVDYRSGLHSGFLWRDTLVQAWVEIARQLGVHALEILSAANSKCFSVTTLASGVANYDEVAERMDFVQTAESDDNWVLTL